MHRNMYKYMQQHRRKQKWAFPLLLVFTLTGCELFGPGPGPGVVAPEITSFSANPTTITAPSQEVTLSWQLSGAVTSLTLEPGGVAVSGSSTTVTPAQTTTYTLRASNSAGATEAQTTVTLEDGALPPPPPEQDPDPPMGNFAVGPTADGPFTNDRGESIFSPDDERVLQVDPGDTFFAQVSYSDPSGVTDIQVSLVNSSPPGVAGALGPGENVSGFTLVGAVNSGCDLAGAPASVTCVYQIEVDDDVVNIDQLSGAGDEFAYVFRTNVTDSVGNTSNEAIRGYVVVGEASTTPPPPPPPADNQAPTASFEATLDDVDPLTVSFDASGSSDPDGDELEYSWDFGDGSTGEGVETSHTYSAEDSYQVTLTVTDPGGLADSVTEEVEVGGPSIPTPPITEVPVIESFTANGDEDETTAPAGESVTLEWELSGTEPEAISILVEEEGIGIPGTPIEPDEPTTTSVEVESVDVTTTYTLIVEGPEDTEPAQGVVVVRVEDADAP